MKIISEKRTVGLGDLVSAIATPIAGALGLDCVDAAGKLKAESGCGQRAAALNELVPDITHPLKSAPDAKRTS